MDKAEFLRILDAGRQRAKKRLRPRARVIFHAHRFNLAAVTALAQSVGLECQEGKESEYFVDQYVAVSVPVSPDKFCATV